MTPSPMPDGLDARGKTPSTSVAGAPDASEASETPGRGPQEVHVMTEPGFDTPIWIDGIPTPPEDLGLRDEVAERIRDWARVVDVVREGADAGPEGTVAMLADWMGACSLGSRHALLGRWVGDRVKDAVGDVPVVLHLDPPHPGDHRRPEPVVVPPHRERETIPVRLMNEHGADLPVRGDTVTAWGVGRFSPALEERLTAWARQWAELADPSDESPLRDDVVRAHEEEGAALRDALAAELGPDYVVTLVP
ncbi:hypothetical protein [Mobilicoccus pelagius]|uniref:Uncharacterized protein n=1 Tax=Mobilicoccus pelagius NBRC 104925 TaxID=1089455 RepID=H5URD7_9MICO|nr:hypothetical protein [Mobilicoccus pelagius]GAB48295.1 hypothetical protein MOPEL_071_00100 [Mobilicoccus pelagius NBRC 104925]